MTAPRASFSFGEKRSTPPAGILGSFLGAAVDAMVRHSVAVERSDNGRAEGRKSRTRNSRTRKAQPFLGYGSGQLPPRPLVKVSGGVPAAVVAPQWAEALLSVDPTLQGEGSAFANLVDRIRDWAAPALHPEHAAFRLCFRLERPEQAADAMADDAANHVVGGVKDPAPWVLQYDLQVALGDQVLTREELEQLAAFKAPPGAGSRPVGAGGPRAHQPDLAAPGFLRAAPPLPGARVFVAYVFRGARAGRLPCRRHGVGQDCAAHRLALVRAGEGPCAWCTSIASISTRRCSFPDRPSKGLSAPGSRG